MGKKLHLHLDSDASSKALYNALLERGHDVTRTPTHWMPFDAGDEGQPLGTTEQGRAICNYSVWQKGFRKTGVRGGRRPPRTPVFRVDSFTG